MELKLHAVPTAALHEHPFNRTILELKPDANGGELTDHRAFNRTILELKRAKTTSKAR